MTALMRGDVDIVCLPAAAVAPQLAAAPGRPATIRILAVTTASRSALVPGVPTLTESGIDVEVDSWNGLVAPAGTPAALVDRIAREVSAVMTADGVRARLATQLMEPVPGTPAEFRARIADDLARWGAVIRAAKIQLD
jgi:tripartite-type tricarboxylate transporter receptor subunit TctC